MGKTAAPISLAGSQLGEIGREAELRTLNARYTRLTSRERDVRARVVAGLPNKQVGNELGITEITVKAHRDNMMRKMEAESLADLASMATRLRLMRRSATNAQIKTTVQTRTT